MLGLAAPEIPLGFREHGGCDALLSHHCSLAAGDLLEMSLTCQPWAMKKSSCQSSAGLESSQKKGPSTPVVIS